MFILFYLFFGTFKLKQHGQLKFRSGERVPAQLPTALFHCGHIFLSFQHFWAMMTKAEEPACIHRGDSLNSGSGNSLMWSLRKDGRARQTSEDRFIALLERADD